MNLNYKLAFGVKRLDSKVEFFCSNVVLNVDAPQSELNSLVGSIDDLNGTILVDPNDIDFAMYDTLSDKEHMKIFSYPNTDAITKEIIETLVLEELDNEHVISIDF